MAKQKQVTQDEPIVQPEVVEEESKVVVPVTCDDVEFTIPADCTGTKLTELFNVDEKKRLFRTHEGRDDEAISRQGSGSLTIGKNDKFITK